MLISKPISKKIRVNLVAHELQICKFTSLEIREPKSTTVADKRDEPNLPKQTQRRI